MSVNTVALISSLKRKNIMSLLQEIFKWTKNLPAWQSDAVARLLVKQTLIKDDIDDIFALLKTENGITDPQNRTPKPLREDQIPVPFKASSNIKLNAIKNMNNVNAIADDQCLTFNPQGLTVIYGDNGSGKSGYSRVFKRACRARDQAEDILPNVNVSTNDSEKAKADFELQINGSPRDVQWTNGTTSPKELSSITIFDSRCAHAYLDREGDFSYRPFGLDVFDRLAKLCDQFRDSMNTEISKLDVDITKFKPLHGDTAVGKLVLGLSKTTDLNQVDRLATISKEDSVRYNQLQKSLISNDPQKEAIQFKNLANRITRIEQNVIRKLALVDDTVVTNLCKLDNKHRKAGVTAKMANKFFKKEGLLPGTGENAWRELFEAARKFAEQSDPIKTFPNLDSDSPCPLCQQPLAEGAERLKLFESFIKADVQQAVGNAEKEYRKACQLAIEDDLTLDLDAVTYSEIKGIDHEFADKIRAFEQSLIARKKAIKEAIGSHQWDEIKQMMVSPAGDLNKLAEALIEHSKSYEEASKKNKRALLQKEFNELAARIKLSEFKVQIYSTVRDLCHQDKLSKCLQAVKTNSISLKASELTKKFVSEELRNTLNQEFKALRVDRLKVVSQDHSKKGKFYYSLKLERSQKCNPHEILSEGERQAIALGSFLAEINMGGKLGGVVLDDPVSSLDHLRRHYVANRLVEEATKRQVIVFTHDLPFLSLLNEVAKKDDISICYRSLTSGKWKSGIVKLDLPFAGKNTKGRIGELRDKHQCIDKLFREENNTEFEKEMKAAYSDLRDAWERAIEEVLLRGTVTRFKNSIETIKLAGVSVTDEDYKTIYDNMKECSRYMHDTPQHTGISLINPDDLCCDIKKLDDWRKEVEDRSKKIQKKRRK